MTAAAEVPMFSPQDRRSHRLSVDELRRYVRERDEECYLLRAALSAVKDGSADTSASPIRRPVVLLTATAVLMSSVAAAAGSVWWYQCGSLAHAAAIDVSADRRMPSDAGRSSGVITIAEHSPACVGETVSTSSALAIAAPRAHAVARRIGSRPRPRYEEAAVKPQRISTARRPHHPRPLSPNEFGRLRDAQS
jgi:hypothetical protein